MFPPKLSGLLTLVLGAETITSKETNKRLFLKSGPIDITRLKDGIWEIPSSKKVRRTVSPLIVRRQKGPGYEIFKMIWKIFILEI